MSSFIFAITEDEPFKAPIIAYWVYIEEIYIVIDLSWEDIIRNWLRYVRCLATSFAKIFAA